MWPERVWSLEEVCSICIPRGMRKRRVTESMGLQRMSARKKKELTRKSRWLGMAWHTARKCGTHLGTHIVRDGENQGPRED